MTAIDPAVVDQMTKPGQPRVRFLLGAGFSRAISDAMPVMEELGELLLRRYKVGETRSSLAELMNQFGGNVEELLAYLTHPPPYLPRPVRLELEAHGANLTKQVAHVIKDAEYTATTDPPPDWLPKLIRWWHDNRATVITLNYDTLIERCAAWTLRSETTEEPLAASSLDVTPIPPLASRLGSALGSDRVDSFKLCKLHGSIDWFWPDDRTSDAEPVYRSSEEPWGEWGTGSSRDDREHSWLQGGLSPALVPPAGSKEMLTTHPVIRQQWKYAGFPPRSFPVLVVCGYSLPAADRQVRQLLAQIAQDSHTIVVDRDDAPVLELDELLNPTSDTKVVRVKDFAGIGDDAVRGFVQWLGSLDGQ